MIRLIPAILPICTIFTLGKVKVNYCKKQAMMLSGDGALAPVLRDLDALARKEDPRGQEASELAESARKWAAAEVVRLAESAKDRPAGAYVEMARLSKRIKGLPEEEALGTAMQPLQADKDVKSVAKILLSVAVVKQRAAGNPRVNAAVELKKAKAALAGLLAGGELSETLQKEVKEAVDGL